MQATADDPWVAGNRYGSKRPYQASLSTDKTSVVLVKALIRVQNSAICRLSDRGRAGKACAT